jgi:hypothetical protein
MSQGNSLLTEGFLALVFCSTALLSPLLLMRLITALSGFTVLMLIRDACGLVDQISLGQANPQLVFRKLNGGTHRKLFEIVEPKGIAFSRKITTEFGKLFHGPVGTLQELTRYCEHLVKRRRHFSSCCQHLKAGYSQIPCNNHSFQISLTIQWVGPLWL